MLGSGSAPSSRPVQPPCPAALSSRPVQPPCPAGRSGRPHAPTRTTLTAVTLPHTPPPTPLTTSPTGALPTVLLWDIDGTLLRTPGLGVRAFARALETVTGRPIARVQYDFGGKTDPSIARDLLAAVGVDDASIAALVPQLLTEVERIYDEFADELRSSIVRLPGAAELLDRFHALQALQSVVTGNIQFAARRKLEAGDMHHRLLLDHGGYGSDHHERAELVRIALARLAAHEGVDTIDRERVWIIGDTPRDAACARDNGVRCLLVATGTYDVAALEGLGAEHVLADLADVDRVVGLLSA